MVFLGGIRSRLLLLWLSGISLRLTVLAVPPVLPEIHHQLHLDETAVGALTALPVLLLAVVAVPGSLLVAKVGARSALLLGLLAIGLGGAVRGIGDSATILFGGTLVMGIGIAVCQPSLPSLVRGWLPDRIGFATATFSNGMLIGEILPVAIMGPFLVGAVQGWQTALQVWSVPVAVTAVAVFLFTQNEPHSVGRPPAKWWPDWRDKQVWILGLTLGGASAAYWGANAFIPELLKHQHHGSYITAALTALNVAQLPASFLIATWPNRLVSRRWPLVIAGVSTVTAAVGILTLPPTGLIIAAGLLGLSTAWIFVLTLALPPLLSLPGDTHRLSAAMFTISYTCPFLGSLLGGALWDATGVPQMAFVTLFIGGALIFVAPFGLDVTSARPVQDVIGATGYPIAE